MSLEPVLIDGEWRQAEHPAGQFPAVDPATKARCPGDLSGLERRRRGAGLPGSGRGSGGVARRCSGAHRALPRRLRSEDRRPCRRAGRDRGPRDRAAGHSAPPAGGAAPDHEPAAPGGGGGQRPFVVPRHDRHQGQHPLDVRAARRGRSSCSAPTTSRSRSTRSPAAISWRPSRRGIRSSARRTPATPARARCSPSWRSTRRAAAGLPPAMVQLIYRTPPDVGFRLVSHPASAATGFTGSKERRPPAEGGRGQGRQAHLSRDVEHEPGVRAARRARGAPPGDRRGALRLLRARRRAVLHEAWHHGRRWRASTAEAFLAEVAGLFDKATPGTLLGAAGRRPRSPKASASSSRTAPASSPAAARSTAPRYAFANTLLRASGDAFLAQPHALQTEAFGTVNLVIVAERRGRRWSRSPRAWRATSPARVYSDTAGGTTSSTRGWRRCCGSKVGRLLNDKMPTGVAVTPAMNHGGPVSPPPAIPASRPSGSRRRCCASRRCTATTTSARTGCRPSSPTRTRPGRCGASSTASGRNRMSQA